MAAPWDVPEHAVPYPEIDTSEDQILLWIGTKGSGKSVGAGAVMRQWPDDTDRLVLDINADMDLSDCDPVRLPAEPPYELPPRRRKEVAETFWWQPDPRNGNLYDDIDRMIGIALYPKERRVMLVADEAGVVWRVHKVGPNGTTAIHQNRHHRMPILAAMPRSMEVAPLLLSQADRITMHRIPNPDDVERIAKFGGIKPVLLKRELEATELRGDFWGLLWVAQPREQRGLYRLPPLPLGDS